MVRGLTIDPVLRDLSSGDLDLGNTDSGNLSYVRHSFEVVEERREGTPGEIPVTTAYIDGLPPVYQKRPK